MTKAIIFDCFGVLTTEAWLPFKAKHFGHDPVLTDEVNQISWRADRGLISRDEAIQATAKLAGISVTAFHEAVNRNVPDEELFRYIRKLKKDYRMGLLSNISGNYLHEIFTPEHLAVFDVISLSFENGYIKPHPQAFEIAADRLHANLDECVLIDDQERNVNGAREAGMRAILYKDVKQLKKELPKLLV
jgi:HAD superfamily hydrolase (TIGR01509 family)